MAEREKDRHKLWEVVDAVNGESVRNKEKGDHKNEGWQLGVVQRRGSDDWQYRNEDMKEFAATGSESIKQQNNEVDRRVMEG